jgi:hypothetical protein
MRTSLSGLALASSALLLFVACGQDLALFPLSESAQGGAASSGSTVTSGGGDASGGSSSGPPVCADDFSCDDGNPCTVDACLPGEICNHQPVTDGPAPDVEQQAGDCTLITCEAGSLATVDDFGDVPHDGNDCTDDVCSGGVPSNPPTTAGSACGLTGAAQCDGAGNCNECSSPNDCSSLPADDECQTRTCDSGACGQSFAANGTAVSSQVAADCMQNVCDGSGATVAQIDDSDVPLDGNECTQDVCSSGTPSNPAEAAGTTCATTGTCDGMGVCEVSCVDASDCPASTTCRAYFCNAGACEPLDTPADVPLPPADQIDGDCMLRVCDGSGGTTDVPFDFDPMDDGDDCTLDQCDNGSPVYPPAPESTPCSDVAGNQFCDGNGACVECIKNNHCPGASKCDVATNTCM